MAVGQGIFWLRWILMFTTAVVAWCSASTYTVTEGGSIVLPCRYSVRRYGLSHVCWGRSCGTFWCTDILLQADGSGVISKVSDRYRFSGNVLVGHVDLIIPKATERDSGQYCCRVDIDGYFNDKKTPYTLTVVKAPTVTTLSVASTIKRVTQTPPSTHERTEPKQQPSNSVKLNPGPFNPRVVEDPLPSPSLQINVPVLSFSLSVLLLLLGFLALVAIKREVQNRSSKAGSTTAADPPHIIHEIQTRKPLEENIYTLD